MCCFCRVHGWSLAGPCLLLVVVRVVVFVVGHALFLFSYGLILVRFLFGSWVVLVKFVFGSCSVLAWFLFGVCLTPGWYLFWL